MELTGIRECLRAKHPVAEEPYEISCDIYGCEDGPKNGRKRILEKVYFSNQVVNFLYVHGRKDLVYIMFFGFGWPSPNFSFYLRYLNLFLALYDFVP